MNKSVAFTYGDGIGPEIMEATLRVLRAADAPITWHEVEMGEKVFLRGESSGIPPATWEAIQGTDAFLKAPLTTPQGGGFKSINVAIRTTLGLYANVRPCVSYAPFVPTKHPGMDVVVIRENEEDLYTGIEYRSTPYTEHALKIISREGCERIIRFAFDYAVREGRKKVTCFTKDNILKQSDGLFHRVFQEIAEEYPEIENEHWIIDIGTAKLADTPEMFDVLVLPNLYGDILSDVAAQIAGSVGLAGSANIGQHAAMYEAIHGSAPRQAGKNTANPSGLLMGAILLLNDLGLHEHATAIHNGWLKTIEEGLHTYDLCKQGEKGIGTKEFADAVIARLGERPETLQPVSYSEKPPHTHKPFTWKNVQRELVGVDVFLEGRWDPKELGSKLQTVAPEILPLSLIANRGARVWPECHPATLCIDSWRCRFLNQGGVEMGFVLALLERMNQAGFPFTQVENLYRYDGEPGFSRLQDEMV